MTRSGERNKRTALVHCFAKAGYELDDQEACFQHLWDVQEPFDNQDVLHRERLGGLDDLSQPCTKNVNRLDRLEPAIIAHTITTEAPVFKGCLFMDENCDSKGDAVFRMNYLIIGGNSDIATDVIARLTENGACHPCTCSK